jgi:hypothetical protein
VSLDCTPPSLTWTRDQGGNIGSIYVPLTLMSKRVLRDLDVCDDAGRALPVLSTSENVISSCRAPTTAAPAEAARYAGQRRTPSRLPPTRGAGHPHHPALQFRTHASRIDDEYPHPDHSPVSRSCLPSGGEIESEWEVRSAGTVEYRRERSE